MEEEEGVTYLEVATQLGKLPTPIIMYCMVIWWLAGNRALGYLSNCSRLVHITSVSVYVQIKPQLRIKQDNCLNQNILKTKDKLTTYIDSFYCKKYRFCVKGTVVDFNSPRNSFERANTYIAFVYYLLNLECSMQYLISLLRESINAYEALN